MPRDHAAFITRFYAASDNAVDHDGYTAFFTPDATLVMGLRSVSATAGIKTLREGMWAAVATRHHVVSAVYPSADDKDELMLHGTVDYTLKTGRALRSEWAARMVFAPGDEERMQFYQVYLDASPMVVAMGKRIEADEEGNVRIV